VNRSGAQRVIRVVALGVTTPQEVVVAEPGQLPAKQPVSALLAGPYGHPFHPVLVTLPIGAWVSSVVLDIGARATDHTAALTLGATWLLGIGLVGAVLAAAVGFLDFLGIPSGTRAYRLALLHMTINLAATALFLVALLLRLDHPDRTSTGAFVLAILGLVGIGVSGVLGGELTFRYGVRVASETDQRHGLSTRD
jgi:uncharacterized membrane protein